MIHLLSDIQAQRIVCIKKYWENYKSTWKNIFEYYLSKVDGKCLLCYKFNISKLLIDISPYYKDCLSDWSFLEPRTFLEINEEIFWNNKHILNENKTVQYNNTIFIQRLSQSSKRFTNKYRFEQLRVLESPLERLTCYGAIWQPIRSALS